MSTKGSASDAKTDANRGLRVGVVGAGVMGSNHARVLAGLPGVTLVGIVDPLPEHRARATAIVGCRAFTELD
jgi:UDP-N-acetylglucosamine 3-dehydrogenase